jgi:hypothetical protein
MTRRDKHFTELGMSGTIRKPDKSENLGYVQSQENDVQ